MEEEKENTEDAEKPSEPVKPAPRLLLVDSDKKTQENLPRLVGAAGIVVDSVETPEEAIKLLQNKGSYAIILAECNKSDVRGGDIFQKARTLAPHASRILAYAKVDDKKLMDSINNGEPYRILKKPFDNKLLMKVVQEGVRQFEVNKATAGKLKLLGKLETEYKKARGQAASLKEQVGKLQSRVQMILGGIALFALSYATVYGVQAYQEGKMLEDNSIQMGAWILFKNKTAKDTTSGKTWMVVDFRNVEKRAPRTWDEAVAWKDKMNKKLFGGYDDWRLPTLREYRETYDPNHTKMAYENREDYKVGYPAAFADGGGYGYWASDSTSPENAGYFFFIGGYDKMVARDYSSPSMSVRLVRGG